MLSAILAAYPAYLIYGARHCRQQQASIRFLSTSSSSYIEHTHTVRFTLKNTMLSLSPRRPPCLPCPPFPPAHPASSARLFLRHVPDLAKSDRTSLISCAGNSHPVPHRYTCPPSCHPTVSRAATPAIARPTAPSLLMYHIYTDDTECEVEQTGTIEILDT